MARVLKYVAPDASVTMQSGLALIVAFYHLGHDIIGGRELLAEILGYYYRWKD
jgi:hypothetical protein